ncbi:HD domain-containing protein [Candidatus Woesearchaeota archaeon]|nr:HD domain-containing protein [Candidatus Woesearchaeota archaeon]
MDACQISKYGRRHEEVDDRMTNDPFLNDFNKILQSKAFRRLAYKTQVMTLPDNPHVRTRLVHTNEVIVNSATIAHQLRLNVYLCMAIAAGHDIGHTPSGHPGESLLTELGGRPFKHYVNSVVVAQHIERKARGLNLAFETLEGMLNHSRGSGELYLVPDLPQEYWVVMYADKISYTFSDLNDAVRYGYLSEAEVPDCAHKIGRNQRTRTEATIKALVEESREKDQVIFSEGPVFEQFDELKRFMYTEVYPKINKCMEPPGCLAVQENFIRHLHHYFQNDVLYEGIDPVLLVSLLTDREVYQFGELLSRTRRPTLEQIKHFGIFEIIPHIRGKEIDYANPDLDWGRKA